ncbi:MAG: sigma-54 dependent transcriptional regulator [Thermodesulfobacteriota bacterium]
MFRILLVHRQPQNWQGLQTLLYDRGYRSAAAGSGEAALEQVRAKAPDLVILDLDLPGLGGLETLQALKQREPFLPVIVTAAGNATHQAIEATKLGAFDYLPRPFSDQDLLQVVEQALQVGHFLRSPVSLEQDVGQGDALIGASKPMQEVYKAIGRVAPTEATVLIRGESGTGKELVARAIYQHSGRVGRPFVVINCVAIPETLLESELFGYEKGAFTGAANRRIGKVEQAHGGTIFLDEIGDMPLGVQAKLLRLLQEKSIERLGGTNPRQVDVRIIAATNRDLEAAMSQDLFREDLYYRLNVVSLTLPPLRARLEDVPALAGYFLQRFARNLGVRNPGLTSQAAHLLARHDWPGNVRELANAMEKCLIFSQSQTIGEAEVNNLVFQQEAKEPESFAPNQEMKRWALQALARGQAELLTSMTDHLARLVIGEALKLTDDNRTRAAQMLGISRPSLVAKIKKYGLGR